MAVKRIGETINVTFSNNSTQDCKITGRNWWGDKFVSYIIRLNNQDLTVNIDGSCQWLINP